MTDEVVDQPITEEIPAAVEYDLYEYQPTDRNNVPIGPKQTIKYTRGNLQEALDIATQNHVESMRGAYELRQSLIKSKTDELPDGVERSDINAITFKPRQLTDDEQWTINQNPGSPESRKLIIESELGATPDQLRGFYSEVTKDVIQLRAKEEAEAFVAATPEYYVTQNNSAKLINYILERNMKPTKENFGIAYNQLRQALSLEEAPTVTEETLPNAVGTATPEPIPGTEQVTRQPVLTASGLNRRNSSTQGSPITSRSQWTVEQVNKMSGTEYQRHFQGPHGSAFKKFVNDNASKLD